MKWSVVITISIVSILMILLSPDTIFDFDPLYNVNQFCKDGFYNSVNSSEVFDCKACDCNTTIQNRMGPTNFCNKRTGHCLVGGNTGCFGKLIASPSFRRGNIEKVDTDGFSQHWIIRSSSKKDKY